MSKHKENVDRIDDYLVDVTAKPRTAKIPRVQAKRSIASLIQQDSHSQVDLIKLAKGVVKANKSVPGRPASSPHITDLRPRTKQSFDRPQRRGFRSWFTPIQPQSKSRPELLTRRGGSLSMSTIVSSLRPDKPTTRPAPVTKNTTDDTAEITFKQNVFSTAVIFASLLLVLILPLKAVTWTRLAYSTIQSVNVSGAKALEQIVSGLSAVEQAEYGQASQEFKHAVSSLQAIRGELESYSQKLGAISALVPPIQAATQLTEAGQQLTQAAALVTSIIEQPDSSITDSLYSVFGKIDGAITLLNQAHQNIELIPNGVVPSDYRQEVIALRQQLPTVGEQLSELKSMSEVLYQLLGGQNLSRILFVFQNNREMRPTGGFIGSFALVDFHRGQVSAMEFPGQGSYYLDGGMREKIAPPYALQLLTPAWYMRDANWWPDFPTSAKKISSMYVRSGGPTVDAVIAINSDVLRDLLKIVGPIELPDYQVTLNSQNVYDVLQTEVELEYDKQLNEPKKILTDALPLLIDKVFSHPQRLELVEFLSRSLASRDIQLYAENSELQETISQLRWDGAQKHTDGDYLQVVSTNLGGGKTDSAIEETISHRAEIRANGTIEATVTVTKQHKPDPTDFFAQTNNVDYVRFYVPKGSQLISAGGFTPPDQSLFATSSQDYAKDSDLEITSGIAKIDDRSGTRMYDELQKTVFANWIQVKPQAKTTVFVTYRLPFRLQLNEQNNGTRWLNIFSDQYHEIDSYSLLLQRQSGKKNTTIESVVIFDPSFKVVWSRGTDQQALSVAERLVSFSTALDRDHYFALLLTKSNLSD